MANKNISHSYGGMMQDVTKSKFSNSFYFEGKNIRILATDSQTSGSITNEKGTTFITAIPKPLVNATLKTITYGTKTLSYNTTEFSYTIASADQQIIGTCNSKDHAIILSTDNQGYDCIWKVHYVSGNITLLYLRNLGFSTSRPIQVLNNYENKAIDKIYWVDGLNQMRFINLEHSLINQDFEELINLPSTVIDMVGKCNLSQPTIKSISPGGIHTSGMIQYAYSLYRVNSSQTKTSPISVLISLDKGAIGGGELNEIIGASPIVNIKGLDTSYTNVKVYAIKYTTFNAIPSISIIDDREIPANGDIDVFDDGRSIGTLSLEEFLFIGSNIIIPKHIGTKFNRMFLANYTELNFNVDIDCRAYSFNSTRTATVYDDLKISGTAVIGTPYAIVNDIDYDNAVLFKHDSINLNYDTHRFQKNGLTTGGEGKYIKYELTQTTAYNEDSKYFKDDEIYRIGIEFFNNYGQFSQPNWIADFKAGSGNLEGKYNTLKVELKPALFTWLTTNVFSSVYDKPVGYKVVIAERTTNDRTIVTSGILSTMMINDKSRTETITDTYIKSLSETLPKLPNILIRNNNAASQYGNSQPLERNKNIARMNRTRKSPNNELQMAYCGDRDTAGRGFQFNSMVQLYSPEVMFKTSVSLSESTRLRIKGSLKNTSNKSWAKVFNGATAEVEQEVKALAGLSYHYSTINTTEKGGAPQDAHLYGLIAHPPGSDPDKTTHSMFYRQYTPINPTDPTNFTKAPLKYTYDIYGKPETTEKGQAGTNYNNNSKYRYVNSIEGLATDGDYCDGKNTWDKGGLYGRKIVTVSTYGNRCITMVLGNDSALTASYNRPQLESALTFAGLTGENNGLIGELVKSEEEIYMGNLYGGNSYEDKIRTNYIEIGEYQVLNSSLPSTTILSPGDTFVRPFRFARMVRTDTTLVKQGTVVLEELIEVMSESTIDLKNRNDLSIQEWDTRFQPLDAEYHEYNNVYSQQPTLAKRRRLNYNTKRSNSFSTNVIATKVKSAGEIIDSWTDVQVNDVITLDGKYGSINALTNFKDELYTFQSSAVAFLSVNPRVQVQGGDGLSIELGTGQVLDRYKYLSTTSGTVNKWSIVASPKYLYYFDLNNKSIMIASESDTKLSDEKGLHSFFQNNINTEALQIDNPLLKTGVTGNYDYINNELLMSFNQYGNDSFSITYNEKLNQFVSLYDYFPSIIISMGPHLISTDPSNTTLNRHFAGQYNVFYGVKYPSSVTLNINPEANLDCVFDNISFKSEVYLNGVDQPNNTITRIQAYNDYQSTALTTLTVGRNNNIRRKFRDWNALIPRTNRNRIRAPWIKLKLQFDNTSNYRLVLHDLNVYYTV
jgi:hypothetical protein